MTTVTMDDVRKRLRKLKDVDITFCYVKRASLTPSPWNPPIRVQLRNLTKLRESMEEDGFWEWCPLIVDRTGMIVDGHCRWTVAGLLHIDEVPVFIVDEDADTLWPKFNGTRQEVTGAQALQAVTLGMKNFPAKYARQMAILKEVLTEDEFQELGRLGKSPHLVNVAIRIARYIDQEDNKIFIGQAVMWLARNSRMSTVVSSAIRNYVDPNLLERAIRTGRPLEQNYG